MKLPTDEHAGFYLSSFSHTFLGSLKSVMATDCQLYALSRQATRESMTRVYIYKDVIGQLTGLTIALQQGSHHAGDAHHLSRGLQCIGLQQLALTMDISLQYFPTRYVYLASFSNMLKNVSWIGMGAISGKCFLNIATSTGTDITEVYTKTNVINTLASSVGLYCGTRLTGLIRNRVLYMSPLLNGVQAITYCKTLECSQML